MAYTRIFYCFLLIGSVLLSSCSNQKESESANSPKKPEQAEVLAISPDNEKPEFKESLYDHFLEDSLITWQQLFDSALTLDNQISSFLVTPTQQVLEKTLTAWEQTHTHYLSTRFYRQLGIPPLQVLTSPESKELHPLDVRVDQYPVILGYLDSVKGYPQSGIIHSELPLNEENLLNEHQLGDLAYVAVGFHAIEAILEGDPQLAETPDKRFSKEGAKINSSIKRRREYLRLISQMLKADLTNQANAWIKQSGAYSQYLDNMTEQERDARIRQAVKLEKTELEALAIKQEGDISADAIALRKNRVALFTPVL